METIKKVIEIDVKSSKTSINSLKKEIKDLTKTLNDLEVGSEEYNNTLQKLGNTQKQYRDVQADIKAASATTTKELINVTQVVSGLAAGYGAVNAVVTLFGNNSEDLQKTMVKLQAGIALVQGLSGLRGLIQGLSGSIQAFKAITAAMATSATAATGFSISLKAVRAAIVTTGIGALVVALGFLVDYLSKASSGVDKLKSKMNSFEDEMESSINSAKILNTFIKEAQEARDIELAKGIRPVREILEEYLETVSSINAGFKDSVAAAQKQADEAFYNILKESKYYRKEWQKSGVAFFRDYAKSIQEGLKYGEISEREFLQNIGEDNEYAYNAYKSQTEAFVQARNELLKEEISAQKAIRDYDIQAERKQREDAAKNKEEKIKQQKQENSELLALVKQYYEDNRFLLLDEESQNTELVNKEYDTQLFNLQKSLERRLISQEEYNTIAESIEKARDKKLTDYRKDQLKKESEDRLKALQDREAREAQIYAAKERKIGTGASQKFQTKVQRFGSTDYYQSGADVNAEYQATVDYNNQIYNLTVERVNNEKEILNKQLEELKNQKELGLITEQEYADSVTDINIKLDEKDQEISEAKNKREDGNLQAEIDRQQKRQKAIQATFAVASSLTGALANTFKQEANDDKKSTAEREKNFKAYKALAITQAVIDTTQSAQSAYKAMVGIPYVGPILAPIAAAAAVVSGIANVKAIANESLPTSTESSAQTTAPAALSQAPVNYSRNILGDKELEDLNQPVKCYVVESDITSTQTKVQVTENAATF